MFQNLAVLMRVVVPHAASKLNIRCIAREYLEMSDTARRMFDAAFAEGCGFAKIDPTWCPELDEIICLVGYPDSN